MTYAIIPVTRAAVDQRFADRDASLAPAISPDAILLRTCKTNHVGTSLSISLFEIWREKNERAYFNFGNTYIELTKDYLKWMHNMFLLCPLLFCAYYYIPASFVCMLCPLHPFVCIILPSPFVCPLLLCAYALFVCRLWGFSCPATICPLQYYIMSFTGIPIKEM